MKVIWSNRAEKGMHKIENYILNEFGENTRKRFMQEVERVSYMLEDTPNLGNIDPLFENHKYVYRSIIIHRLSKMVYDINNDVIHIAAFYDTRREPKQQADKLK